VTASTMPRLGTSQLGAASPGVEDRPGLAGSWSLSRGQAVAVAVSVALALVVFGYGMVGSYVTVSDLAVRRGVPVAAFVPAGIDGGLISVVVLDLVLAWVGLPVGWLRQVVRVLSVGTIVANAVPGWPDPVAVGLHAAAPVMLLATVEAGRSVLLRRLGVESGATRDPIPATRWLLAPWRTVLLWRRMVLWQVTSYRVALDTELAVRRAAAMLRLHYGRRWRRRAPGDLVWMLRMGVDVDEACTRITELTVSVASGEVDRALGPSGEGGEYFERSSVAAVAATPETLPVLDVSVAKSAEVSDVDQERLAAAIRLNREHWVATGRPASAETLRKRLRIGAVPARALSRAVRAVDQMAVCRPG
jgi:hypothetical protein